MDKNEKIITISQAKKQQRALGIRKKLSAALPACCFFSVLFYLQYSRRKRLS